MPIEIGMLLFPELTQLDLTGPFEVLHRVPGARVHLVWKDTRPVRAQAGLTIHVVRGMLRSTLYAGRLPDGRPTRFLPIDLKTKTQ